MHSLIRQNLQQYLYSYKEPRGNIDNDTNNSVNTRVNNLMRKKQYDEKAGEKLNDAMEKPVAFAIRTNIAYDGQLDKDSPIEGRVISLEPRQFLHIIEKVDTNWWIGRTVNVQSDFGFIPSPAKLMSIKERRCRNILYKSRLKRIFQPKAEIIPYDVVPIMRPFCLLGPSLKGFLVTDMIQKSIFDFLKERFEGRISITRVTMDISLAQDTSIKNLSPQVTAAVRNEIDRIFQLCNRMQIVVIDCDLINYPVQILNSVLAPLIVFVRIANSKVLYKLINSRGKTQIQHVKVQLSAAEKLVRYPDTYYDLIIDDNRLDDACQRLANFIDDYWQATHPELSDNREGFP